MFSFAVKGGLRGYVSSRETLVAGGLQTYVPSVRIRRIPTFDALSTPSQAFCRLRCFRCRTELTSSARDGAVCCRFQERRWALRGCVNESRHGPVGIGHLGRQLDARSARSAQNKVGPLGI